MYPYQIFLVIGSEYWVMNDIYTFLCFIIFSTLSKLTRYYPHLNGDLSATGGPISFPSDDGTDALPRRPQGLKTVLSLHAWSGLCLR